MNTEEYIKMRIEQCKKIIAKTPMNNGIAVMEIFSQTSKLKAYEDSLMALLQKQGLNSTTHEEETGTKN